MLEKETYKVIWFLWLQGKSNMPPIVKLCFNSWLLKNKSWQLHFLCNDNLSDFLNNEELETIKNVSPQAFSDVIRINLLNKHGGVWVDATCYCNNPLDQWLHSVLSSGFFAFSKPGKDRMISSWFLAANKNNTLSKIYCLNTNELWLNNPKLKVVSWKESFAIEKSKLILLMNKKPALWHSWFFVKLLKRVPYFWFHYLFEKLYLKDEIFKQIWDNTPKLSAKEPHQLQEFGLNKLVSTKLVNEIKTKKTPVYKLTWKIDHLHLTNSVLDFLEKENNNF